MSSQHQLWTGQILTRIGCLRDAIWAHGREWDQLDKTAPAVYAEIRKLLDVYADATEGRRTAP